MKTFSFLLFFAIRGLASEVPGSVASTAAVPVGTLAIVQSPEKCLADPTHDCFLKTKSTSARFETKGRQFTLGPESVMSISPNGDVRLLLGNLQAVTEDTIKITTSFAAVEFSGAAWLHHDEAKTWIRNLDAPHLSYSDSFGKEKLGLSVGFEIWISKIDSKKAILKGVARALPTSQTLLNMQSEFGRGFVTTAMIQRYLKAWQGNSESAGEQYHHLVQRQMASFEDRKMKKQRRIEQERKANTDLREMFRRRNSGEVLE